MKKIELQKTVLDLEGQDIVMGPQDPRPLTVGRAIGLILQNSKGRCFDDIKTWELANRCYNDEEIELDKSDFSNLKSVIGEDQLLSKSIKGQILITLEDAPEIADKPKDEEAK